MRLETFDVSDAAELEAFLSLPDRVYAGDPWYCAPFRSSVVSNLRRTTSSGMQRAFLARGDRGEPLARVVARRSPTLLDDAGRRLGMLGFFEALDEPEAARAVLDVGCSWLRESGSPTAVGPMDGDTWHKYRLNVGPRDEPPFLLEPYNPDYYERFWTEAGFQPLETYFSKRLDDIGPLAEALAPKSERALKRGYSLRRFSVDRYDEDMRIIFEISRRIFEGNLLYSPISLDAFLSIYEGLRALIDPDLVWFAHAPSGKAVGFVFAYPDVLKPVAAMRGRSGTLARLRFLMARRRPTTVNYKTLGLVPEHRRTGLDAALVHRLSESALSRGYRACNLCLIRRGNRSGALAHTLGMEFREYVLFSRTE